MAKKVIHIRGFPLDPGLFESYYIKHCLDEGIPVEHWNVGPIVDKWVGKETQLQGTYLKTFYTLDDLEKEIQKQNISETLFNLQLYYTFKYRKIFRLFAQYNAKVSFFSMGKIPSYTYKVPLYKRLLRRIKNPFDLLKRSVLRIYEKFYEKKYLPDLLKMVFVAGDMAKTPYMNRTGVKFFKINYRDYDLFLRNKTHSIQDINEKYCVFIDQGIVGHPDQDITGTTYVDPKKYFSNLERFFHMIENQLGIKVVIAQHPKVDYKNTFNNFTMLKYKTNELIKDAEFAICHNSTSIGFAVMYNRPLVFVYDNELVRIAKRPGEEIMNDIRSFSKELNMPLLNLDQVCDDFELLIPKVNQNIYQKYKYNYLTWKESENTESSKLFFEYIKEI